MLGIGEVVMLVAALLGTVALLVYLNRALENQPAVLTPSPKVAATNTPRSP